MRYTLVSFIFLSFCFLVVAVSSNGSNWYKGAKNGTESKAETEKVQSVSSASSEVGKMSCAEAHALIRMKKDDQSLRSGMWRLEQGKACPVLSEEAYIALQQ
jgi:hypothetical protein